MLWEMTAEKLTGPVADFFVSDRCCVFNLQYALAGIVDRSHQNGRIALICDGE